MQILNYNTLQNSCYEGHYLKDAPEKVMQFGEGNFLRGFVDYWFDVANEKAGWNGKCVVIKPRKSSSENCDKLNAQDCLYTLHVRGINGGEQTDTRRVISSVSRCIDPHTDEGFEAMMKLAVSEDLAYIVSNTTEAGIVYDPVCLPDDRPCTSFPGKLTQVLHARYQARKKGLVILPCELNDQNGDLLKSCVLAYAKQWALGSGFEKYLLEECLFCNTLVDRIVPGGIRNADELNMLDLQDGYCDRMRVACEVFGVWNIEGPAWLEDKLPFKAAGVNCVVVPDVVPYKKRKVRILNGAHTGFVLGAYLSGYDIVRQCMHNDTIRGFMNKMLYEEVIPTLHMDYNDVIDFAAAVQDRFCNPYIDHALLSISLNSTSKWKARLLPTLMDSVNDGGLPKCIVMSFAAYIAFYSGNIQALCDEGLVCLRPNGERYVCSDERWALEFFYDHRNDSIEELVHAVMKNMHMWDNDLTEIAGFEDLTVTNLKMIREAGAEMAFASCL